MIGKIMGALVGGRLAQETNKIDGTTGAVLGATVPFIISRLSIPAMIALGVGGYVAKKSLDKRNAGTVPRAKPQQPEPIPLKAV